MLYNFPLVKKLCYIRYIFFYKTQFPLHLSQIQSSKIREIEIEY